MQTSNKHQEEKPIKKSILKTLFKSFFWFFVGVTLGLFVFISFVFIFFKSNYENKVYPGMMIDGVSFEGKTQEEVKAYFADKNRGIADLHFVFSYQDLAATVSAKQLSYGYDETLLAQQIFGIGRSQDTVSNLTLIFDAYLRGVNLPASYHYSEKELLAVLEPLKSKVAVEPENALFEFENGKVRAFRLSKDGQKLDIEKLKENLSNIHAKVFSSEIKPTLAIPLSVEVVKPEVTTEKVNDRGIKELIGSGTSYFRGAVESRTYNVNLAASRVNGALVDPGEIFSFNKALGDVSSLTGYKQAYIIQNGRTVLGDGGGVCQVSTTLFRAILNAGLPVIERNAHAFRVRYYEQDAPPGFDATIFTPDVDLRFKNDTKNSILIQSEVDLNEMRITYYLYGTKDGREVTVSKPVITSQTPPPEPLYQDDPQLPIGTVKQVDWAAWGANVEFSREVKKDNKVIISEKFISNFRPWQAVYLRGTKTN